MFDINDFDETLPGPWEWDVKRLAASFEIAGARPRATTRLCAARSSQHCARSYREAMLSMAEKRAIDLWYTHVNADLLQGYVVALDEKDARRMARDMHARARTSTTSARSLG